MNHPQESENENENRNILRWGRFTDETETPTVQVQNIGGSTFFQFQDSLISFDDLKKYRKVFRSNAMVYYISAICLAVLILIATLFIKDSMMIACGCGCLLCGMMMWVSTYMISKKYKLFVIIILSIGVLSSILLLYKCMNYTEKNYILSLIILLITVAFTVVLLSLTYYATRLNTILTIVPENLYPDLKCSIC